jgi:hypothetical protein
MRGHCEALIARSVDGELRDAVAASQLLGDATDDILDERRIVNRAPRRQDDPVEDLGRQPERVGHDGRARVAGVRLGCPEEAVMATGTVAFDLGDPAWRGSWVLTTDAARRCRGMNRWS